VINPRTRIFLSVIGFFILSFAARAQQKAWVQGTVKDSLGTPVQDVLVGLVGGTQQPVYTDSTGKYHYQIPAGTEVEILFFHPGFTAQHCLLTLKDGETREFSPILHTSASTKLEGVTVVGGRHNFQEVSELDAKIITFIPMPSGDFNSILMTQPGVFSRTELGSEYSVRGGSYDENLIYVNGIEIYRPFLIHEGQQEGLSFVNPDMVSSVLFSAGGFEAKYGDKMSSVLDVTYKKPTHFAGSASASLLGGTFHLEGTDESHRLTWILGARYKSNQYLLKSLDVQGDYKPQFGDVQLYMTYALTDRLELDILGNYSLNEYRFVPQSEQTSFGTISEAYHLYVQFQGQEIDRFQTITGAVSLIYKASNKVNLRFTTSAFNSQESQDYDIEGDYLISQLETNIGSSNLGQAGYAIGVGTYLNHARDDLNAFVYNFQHTGSYDYKENSKLLWGFTLQHEEITAQTSQWNLIDSAGYSLPYNPYILQLQNVIKTFDTLHSNRMMGFVENITHWQTSDTGIFTFTAGIRANYWDMNKQLAISPRATLAYKPNWKNDLLFRLSSGIYYQPPFYREMMDEYGQLHLNAKDQESIHFVAGADWNFKAWHRPFKWITEAYYKDLVNVVPYEIDNVAVRYFPAQTAKGFVEGIDMKVNGEFVKNLESWFSLSVMQAKYQVNNAYYYEYYNSFGQLIVPGVTANTTPTDSVKHSVGQLPLPTDERVTFSLFFQDYLPKFPNFKVHLNLLFGTGIPFGPPNKSIYADTLRMQFYKRVDIGCSYLVAGKKGQHKTGLKKYFHSLWIGVEVFNLLQVNNVISYNWIADVNGRKYAVPNYLTSREVNVRAIVEF
jgi:hypothetical protein